MTGFGCAIVWVPSALPLLRSEDTPLTSGPLTTHELSWIGSAITLGAFIGNMIFGYFNTILGSRHCTFLIGFPQLVGVKNWKRFAVK